MENLKGKVAFITGGASGIGLGIAKACGNAGMKVVIVDIRRQTIDEVIPFFEKRDWPVYGIALDVTDRDAYVKAADEAESVFGNIHLLINNAGVEVPMVPLWEAEYKDVDFITNVNFHGVINGIRTIVPRMLAHGEECHVVATSSQSGLSVVRGATMYCATKAGVVGMMETLATDLMGTNIGVSIFCPGPVQGNLSKSSLEVRPDDLQVEDRQEPAAAPPPPPAEGAPAMPNVQVFIPAVEAGERVVRGIRRGDLYIFTHKEMQEGVRFRAEAMLRAYPDEPENVERAEFMRNVFTFLVRNDVYGTQTTPGAPDWDLSVYDEE